MATKLDTEKLKRWVKDHKTALLVLMVVATLTVSLLSTQKAQKSTPSSTEKDAVAFKDPSSQLLPAALQDGRTEPLPPGVDAETSEPSIPGTGDGASRTLIIEHKPAAGKASETETPIPDFSSPKSSATATGLREPLSLEKVRGVYEIDYQLLEPVSVAAQLAQTPNPRPTTLATSATSTAPAPAPSDQATERFDLVLPGTLLKVQLIDGLLATDRVDVPFAGFIEKVVTPELRPLDLTGCTILGKARLDLYTRRIQAELTDVSCRDKYGPLLGFARDHDFIFGLVGRYHERLSQRVFFSFFGAGGQAYMEGRARALEERTTVVGSTGETIAQDIRVTDPAQYGLWQGFNAGFGSAREALAAYSSRQIPVSVLDPLSTAYFVVQRPAKLTYLTAPR